MATRSMKIYRWNMARGLISKGFDLNNEVRMLLEELDELKYSKPKQWYNFFNIGRKESNVDEKVDSLNDIIVVATGGIYKLNYDADKTMDEVIREINSRVGSIDNSGKFQKDTSDRAKRNWYKARFSRCKLDN